MGRIADEAKQADERTPWTNKVDDVATLQTVVSRLGVFFDRFADLVEQQYR